MDIKRGFAPITILISILVIILVVVLSFAGLNKASRLPKSSPSPIATLQPSPTATPISCGGILGATCPPNYTCKYLKSKYYPDVEGTCLENSETSYACPPSGWVDCMPSTDPKPGCSQEAMEWYKMNCPDFKGGAY